MSSRQEYNTLQRRWVVMLLGGQVSLEELRRQFIVSEDVLAEQLADLVGTLKNYVVVGGSGEVHLLKASRLPVRVRLELALSARLVAAKLDSRISSAISLDELQRIIGVQREQIRARVSELVRERFADTVGQGLYQAISHRVDRFVRELSLADTSDTGSNRGKTRGPRPTSQKGATAKRPRTRLGDLLGSLISGGFFRQPRDLHAVQISLAESGHHYPVTTLSGTMLRQVRHRNLRRLKQDNRWVYVEG